MKIPLSKDTLPFDSPTYRQITHDIAFEGYQSISISGPRNCGKTYFECELLLYLHENVPGLVSCIAMLEYSNLRLTIIPTLRKLCKNDLKSPKNPFKFHGGYMRPDRIEFDNGGELYFFGMSEDGKKARGLEADVFLYSQIERDKEAAAYREVIGSMAGGRRGTLKLNGEDTYLFIGDCNPDSKTHWWYQEKEQGLIDGWYDITHKDHPQFYSYKTNEWTQKGINTTEDLRRRYPAGHWRMRMVDGIWCVAEGACFTEFDEKRHVKPMMRDDFGVDTTWKLSIDFGNTTAMGLYALVDNKLHLFKEYYKLDPSPTRIVEYLEYWYKTYNLSKYSISKMITDIETGNRAILSEAGYYPVVADKEVPITEGIQMMQKGFQNDLFNINENSLDHPDPLLEGKIRCLVDELPAIHYPSEDQRTGSANDDKPHKLCIRHAADHARYCVVDSYTTLDYWIDF